MKSDYFMAVDVQNLWYSCRHNFGNEYRVDYNALLNFVVEQVISDDEASLNSTAYLVVSSNHDQTNFISALRQLNFNIKKRHIYFNKNKSGATNTDWDVGITADAFMQEDEYDTFILVSGDGDFIYLAEPLREIGKEVIVVSFEQSLNRTLATGANKVFHLDESIVYSPRARYEDSQRKFI